MIPDRYQPTEEIIDAGYATLTFYYEDVTKDNGDFTDGIAGLVYKDGKRGATDCGKIGLWAYAAMAVMDYAETLPELDKGRISVVGHSRLGKTALLTGALDERFYCAISNDSGCSGAALSRENTGERIADIMNRFPYWFSESYAKYIDNEDELPFDQHWLIAANAPHRVYVASAEGDLWACPVNEYRSCIAASEYYEAAIGCGFVYTGTHPRVGRCFHKGMIGYHERPGTHYLSREDWAYYIKYLNASYK
jgi:dienelactone hydrolase